MRGGSPHGPHCGHPPASGPQGHCGLPQVPPTQDPDPLTQPSQDFDHMLVRGVEKQGKS